MYVCMYACMYVCDCVCVVFEYKVEYLIYIIVLLYIHNKYIVIVQITMYIQTYIIQNYPHFVLDVFALIK